MGKRAVILGSNSFSGAHFARKCLKEGCEVLGFSRSEEPPPAFLPYRWGNFDPEGFRFVRADLNHDLNRVLEQIERFRPEYVVDFAGQGMVAPSWEQPWQWYETNIVSKVKLHHRLKDFDFLKRYVRISTPEVYGSTEGEVDESAAMNPSTPYAVSHAAIDMSLKAFHRQYGFPVVFTRSSNFYGPGQQLYRIIPRTLLSARLGKKLPLHGGGHSERNFVHVEDFCNAVWTGMSKGETGRTFHIASDGYVSIRSLVEQMAHSMGMQLNDLVEITEDRPGKDKAYYLNTDAIRSLGWKPQTGLEQGIKETLAWVDENLDTLKNLPMEYLHKA